MKYAVGFINFYDKELIVKVANGSWWGAALMLTFPLYGDFLASCASQEVAQIVARNTNFGFDTQQCNLGHNWVVALSVLSDKHVEVKSVKANSWSNALSKAFPQFTFNSTDMEEAKDVALNQGWQFDVLETS